MGEVAVSRKDLGVNRLEREAENTEEECGVVEQGEESSGLAIMWESLLKRRMLRVLLVEADDSTRQVIAALLRKCSYKVAAVSDGLKAWEVLKGRPHNIDLILTEVDLPAISGFALLTLIMEHEICKNIPVIMMSSHDSISTVYKCMLRGAADYLVKPIRKNELSNLWQHVWRKQTSMDVSNSPQDESVAQQKVEGTCENNAASNHSSGDLACIQRNKELIEKGSDAQSSCTKPDLEAKSAPIEDLEEHAQSNYNKAYLSVKKVQENEPRIDLGRRGSRHDCDTIGLTLGISNNGDTAGTLGRDSDFVYPKARTSNFSEACDNNNAIVSSSREATDFTFHTYPTYERKNSPSVSETRKGAPSSQLELTLRRSESHSFENVVIEETNTLVHSNASAFKRYNSRQLETSPRDGKHQIGSGTEFEKNSSYMFTGYNSETSAPSLQRSFSPANVHLKESDIATSQLHHRVFPISVPVKGISYNDISQAYGSVLPPVFYTQSGSPLSMPSSGAVACREPSFTPDIFHHSNTEDHNSSQLYKPLGENAMNGNELTMHRQDHGVETFENREGHFSSATDQSASSGFCNGSISHLNSVAYGSNYGNDSTADQSPAIVSYESKTEDLTKYGFSNRSVQREAALTKFRLKRKDRCYEKKVRYESRKKLAEQRPRIKGQFVRQVQPDLHPTTEKNGSSYDS